MYKCDNCNTQLERKKIVKSLIGGHTYVQCSNCKTFYKATILSKIFTAVMIAIPIPILIGSKIISLKPAYVLLIYLAYCSLLFILLPYILKYKKIDIK